MDEQANPSHANFTKWCEVGGSRYKSKEPKWSEEPKTYEQ